MEKYEENIQILNVTPKESNPHARRRLRLRRVKNKSPDL